MLNLLPKTIQKKYAVNTREWATTQKTCRLATASASGCGGCCSRPTKTTSWKSRSNLPLIARLSTCRKRMEQLLPSRLLNTNTFCHRQFGAIFQVFIVSSSSTLCMSRMFILVLPQKKINSTQFIEPLKVKTTSLKNSKTHQLKNKPTYTLTTSKLN